MGQIADAMLDGILDMYTGEYLGEAVGYPRTRQEEFTPTNKKRGISSFLVKRGLTKIERRNVLLAFYLGEQNKSTLSNEKLCVYASSRFSEFVKFVDRWVSINQTQ